MHNLKNLTLLYIEDNDELREQFVHFLKPKFKEIIEAVDGVEALEKYDTHHPDIMVVDINLPKLDGLEVIEHIRKHDKETPIIVLSAYSNQEKLLKAITLGLSDYLVKPIPRQTLLTLLDKMALEYGSRRKESDLILLQNGYFWKKEEKILSYADEIIPLTKREIILLDFLIERLDNIITFDVIIALIWQNEDDVDCHSSLSQLIRRLRKKLPEELIENIYAAGYRITSK